MEDYPGSKAQGSVIFSDSADWDAHAGPVDFAMLKPSYLASHIKMAKSGRPAEKLAAARVLTILSSEDSATLDVKTTRVEITAKEGHIALLTMLKPDDTKVALWETAVRENERENERENLNVTLAREAAAAALCNLCAQDDTRAEVVEAGGIDILIRLIGQEGQGDELLKYACGALGNLARENQANQDAIAGMGGIQRLIHLCCATGIRDEDDDRASLEDAENDDGLELNASIALRKLAIGHAKNYDKMSELLTESQLRYFLHAELPNPEGVVPEAEAHIPM